MTFSIRIDKSVPIEVRDGGVQLRHEIGLFVIRQFPGLDAEALPPRCEADILRSQLACTVNHALAKWRFSGRRRHRKAAEQVECQVSLNEAPGIPVERQRAHDPQ